MSWRNQAGSTGSNNIPLGTRRRGGDSNGTPDFAPPPNEGKRGRSPERVLRQLIAELDLLRTRDRRSPVVHRITHAAFYAPRSLVQ